MPVADGGHVADSNGQSFTRPPRLGWLHSNSAGASMRHERSCLPTKSSDRHWPPLDRWIPIAAQPENIWRKNYCKLALRKKESKRAQNVNWGKDKKEKFNLWNTRTFTITGPKAEAFPWLLTLARKRKPHDQSLLSAEALNVSLILWILLNSIVSSSLTRLKFTVCIYEQGSYGRRAVVKWVLNGSKKKYVSRKEIKYGR